jgi:hypothetical protein
MSKTISFKGQLAIGLEDRIKLSTITGKTGYKITKFQILSSTPGVGNHEFVAQIFNKSQVGSIGSAVNFTDSNLLAAIYYAENATTGNAEAPQTIIFDNTKFNQDIFISIADASGGTVPCNYYIELETMDLSDIETTMLTLQSIRTITSR